MRPPVDGVPVDGVPVVAAADDGEPVPPVGRSGRDLARAALASAQRGVRQAAPTERGARRRARIRAANLRRGGYSGAHPDALDPAPAGEILAALFSQRGWARPVAEARVFADWATLVGPDVASRCTPTALVDGELRVVAESTAWATQLRLLSGTVLARLATELGPGIVARMHVTGPVGPSWKHGLRSVRGARGPRDTYG